MKTIRIYGKDLKTEFLLSMTMSQHLESFAMDIIFFEKGEKQKGKLLLKTKSILQKEGNKEIISFTGTIVNKGLRCPCTGFCYTDEIIEEFWITIIEPETEIFKVNVSKKIFIEQAKESYTHRGIKFKEDGNRTEPFSLFENPYELEVPTGILTDRKGTEMFTDIFNNLFPIIKNGGELVFGEYVEEYLIKTITKEDAYLRGVIIS